MSPEVDWFFEKATKWQKEYQLLRTIVLNCGLREELKWGVPCYTLKNNNIVLIHGFKNYCALLFHKGVLLNDTNGILVQQMKNIQSARQIRLTDNLEIVELKTILKAYIYETIEVEKACLKIPMKKTKEFDIPEEFQIVLDENSDHKNAFEALTPG